MPKRQEYIARVRYQNDIPPPPGAPKLLDYEVDLKPLLTAGSLSSVVFQRTNVIEPDIELGMPLDLALQPELFDDSHKNNEPVDNTELDPADRELLGEPVPLKTAVGSSSVAAVVSQIASAHAASSAEARAESHSVAFLRKTAYMTGDSQRAKNTKRPASSRSVEVDPNAELLKIESSFDHAQVPISELRHPKRPGVHAVRSMPVFPDIKQFDQEFTAVRFLGSASLSQLPEKVPDEYLRSSIFAQCGSDNENSWMTFFVASNDDVVTQLETRLNDKRDTLPKSEVEEEAATIYELRNIQENDIETALHRHQFEEIVITSDGESAFYAPITSRTNLKRRRINPLLRSKLKDDEVDILDIALRELTAEEQIQRDSSRSRYDPVTYG